MDTAPWPQGHSQENVSAGTGLLSAWLGHVPRVCPLRLALLSLSPRSGCSFFLEPLPRRSEVPGWGSASAWGRQRADSHGLTAGVALPRKAMSCGVRVAGPVGIWEPLLECSTEFHVSSTATLLRANRSCPADAPRRWGAAGSFPVGTKKGMKGVSTQKCLAHVLSMKIFGCSCWFRGTLSVRGKSVGRLAGTLIRSDGWLLLVGLRVGDDQLQIAAALWVLARPPCRAAQ